MRNFFYCSLVFLIIMFSCEKETKFDYYITASSNEFGAITPSGKIGVNAGQPQTFIFTPNEDVIENIVTIDSISRKNLDEFTFEAVFDNHVIDVKFITPNSFLSETNWDVDSYVLQDYSSGAAEYYFLEYELPCLYDDIFIFNLDGSFELNKNNTACDSQYEFIKPGSYEFQWGDYFIGSERIWKIKINDIVTDVYYRSQNKLTLFINNEYGFFPERNYNSLIINLSR